MAGTQKPLTFTVNPIGKIRNGNGNSTLCVYPGYRRALKELAEFSHANIIRIREDGPDLSVAELLSTDESEGLIRLRASGLSDGEDVYDIKPYFPVEDRVEKASIPAGFSERDEWVSHESVSPADGTVTGAGGLRTIAAVGEYRREKRVDVIRFFESGHGFPDGLDGFSHLRVYWYFHRFDSARMRRTLRNTPPYPGAPVTGVFASRSPVRPNPIALSTVRVRDIDEGAGRLEVTGMDAFPGTPVLCVRPYVPARDRVRDVRVPEWVRHWPSWVPENDSEVPASDSCRVSELSGVGTRRFRDPVEFWNTVSQTLDEPYADEAIVVKGARQNNLKNIDAVIPKRKLTVVTGVSGSGKSSLAFDTVYAESRRRFMDSMSTLSRQGFEQMEKPDLDCISGLPPAVAIEQKSVGRNPRSTVGTITEAYTFLRLLYSRIGHGRESGALFTLTSSAFSYNNPEAMCRECSGLGRALRVDPELIVTKPDLSILDGASPWWGTLRDQLKSPSMNWMRIEVLALAAARGTDLELPWKDLSPEFRNELLYGAGDEKVTYVYSSRNGRSGETTRPVSGAVRHIERLFRDTRSELVVGSARRFMRDSVCTVCGGERLGPEGRSVTVADTRYPEAARMTVEELDRWLYELPGMLTDREIRIAGDLIRSLRGKIRPISDLGLSYLSLDRPVPTLSGGEGQRIRLAMQLDCGLTNLLYVLDEPSSGLHPRDHRRMIRTMRKLRDRGNTVLVVEHDAETMREADWIIDMGPGAGHLGGTITAKGTPDDIRRNPASLTGRYLSGELIVGNGHANGYGKEDGTATSRKRTPERGSIVIRGARRHNLKNIDVRFPLGCLVCVTGVSGSGKSSLVEDILYPAAGGIPEEDADFRDRFDSIEGLDLIDKVINITQAPIGRSPRSTPATYTGLWDDVRTLFASVQEAKDRKYTSGRFSFNDKEGMCPACGGDGRQRIEMHFMPDIWILCPECEGKRFNPETLGIRWNGKTIAEVLDLDVSDALAFFEGRPKILRVLETISGVGLEYLKLGQSALTLSGGEAQRIKIAKELCRPDTGRTLYILDEPTSGLHFDDVRKLLEVLHRLTGEGNSVIVVEHNPDLIREADWILDLGPEGGNGGGFLVAEGTPEDIMRVPECHTGKFLNAL